MRLLIFIHSLSSGGAERVTANLANYWAYRGWEVTVVTLAAQTLDFYSLHSAVRRIALDLAGPSANPLTAIRNNLRRVLVLRKVLRQAQPDVALAMMSSANILLAVAASGIHGVVLVGSERIHPPLFPLGSIRENLRSYLYGRLSAIATLTSESAEWLRQQTRARTIAIIPNAAPWPLPVEQPYLTAPIMPAGWRMLLAVGRLCEQKQFALLVAVFHRLAARFPNWVLVILGEGPDRKGLEEQIAAGGLTHRVYLPGRVGNVGQWYAAADLYVMTSRFEGFPNSLAEAMACGLPAVSFDCDTGPRDIIRHEVDGVLVAAGDVTAMEAALERLMRDESLRRRFGEKAAEARERFSVERIAAMWEQLFEKARE